MYRGGNLIAVQAELLGDDAFIRKLLALERKVGKKVVKKALRAGSKPTLTQAKINATSMVGGNMGNLIARNLAVRAFKKQKPGRYGLNLLIKSNDAFIHVAEKSSHASGRTFIPAAIEFGHDTVPAVGFMRKAADATKLASKKAISNKIAQEILRIAIGTK